jgi:glutamyl-tRNA synthetase
METLSDFSPLTSFLYAGMLPVEKAKYDELKVTEDQLKQVLQFVLWRLEALRDWNRDAIFAELKALADSMEIKLKDFLAPLFIAISGTTASFSVMDAMVLLGSDMSRARVRYALQGLYGEIGKKQLKKLEKAYQALNNA